LENGWKQAKVAAISSAKDLRARPTNYLTSDRVRAISEGMTEEDWAVLNFVSDMRLVTGGQLVKRFWGTREHGSAAARAGRRALKRLATWQVLDPLPRQVGGVRGGSDGFVYGVGLAGRKVLAMRGFHARRLQAPGSRFTAHTLAITELVVRLHDAHRHGHLDLIEVEAEPACWRAYLGPMGARLILKPDLFVRIGVGAYEDRWMVEVDLGTEASGTIQSKSERYVAYYKSGTEQAEHGVFPRVLWAAPDPRRTEQIAAALGRLNPEAHKLFSVCELGEVPSLFAAEARV